MRLKIDSNDRDLEHEINVIPLVDIALVLLIIFMVTAPIIKTSFNIDVPKATASEPSYLNDIPTIQIDSKGRIFFNRKRVNPSELVEVLTNVKSVYIEADRRIEYQKVMDVIDLSKKAGVERVGLVSVPETKRNND